jgi:hypothetical protein
MNNNTFLITIILIFISSCISKNKDVYDVAVGESFEIYYTTNSCCKYCNNASALTTCSLVTERIIDPDLDKIMGGTINFGLVFKAISPGTDTIILITANALDSCNGSLSTIEKYIVHVRAK